MIKLIIPSRVSHTYSHLIPMSCKKAEKVRYDSESEQMDVSPERELSMHTTSYKYAIFCSFVKLPTSHTQLNEKVERKPLHFKMLYYYTYIGWNLILCLAVNGWFVASFEIQIHYHRGKTYWLGGCLEYEKKGYVSAL